MVRDARGAGVRGRVDLTAPDLGVLWVRESVTGERRLLRAADHDLDTSAA